MPLTAAAGAMAGRNSSLIPYCQENLVYGVNGLLPLPC